MKQLPFCSVIVLNYNGADILEQNLNSLLDLNYPKTRFEILVVDNNSEDESKKILDSYFADKKIKVYYLNKNLGFSKGNNYGIQKSKAEYVALINNDCVVGPEWLTQLVKSAVKDKKIFAVNSKILLYPKFINIKFYAIPKLTPVYTWLSRTNLYIGLDSDLKYLSLWRKQNYYKIEIPYDPYTDKSVDFTILFNSRGFKLSSNEDLKSFIKFDTKTINIKNVILNGDDIEYKIELRLDERDPFIKPLDKIQDAGIMVFQDGYARDIGAVVRSGQQFYEYDLKQYNSEKEIYAACGAAVLYNKRILNKIGLLDESFFMYYEDVDISERARFAGFKIIYSPQAWVRHMHSMSAKEWSPFFVYHVERGRLLHIFYNFPWNIFVKEYLKQILIVFVSLISILFKLRIFLYNMKNKKNSEDEPKYIRRIQTVKALIFILAYFPWLLYKRIEYGNKRPKEAISANYSKILSGEWYLL